MYLCLFLNTILVSDVSGTKKPDMPSTALTTALTATLKYQKAAHPQIRFKGGFSSGKNYVTSLVAVILDPHVKPRLSYIFLNICLVQV